MREPLARRVLHHLLPEDDWSDEFLAELDLEHERVFGRRGSAAASELWYARQLLSPSTLRLVVRMRRRAGRPGSHPLGKTDTMTARGRPWTPGFSWLDFRLGLRMLARYPGLTLVGGLAMAFGVWIGAVTFEVTRQWTRPDLGVPDQDRLVGLLFADRETLQPSQARLRDFALWRASLASVEALSAFRTYDTNLVTGGGVGRQVRVAEISASAFALAGVPPQLGRALTPADERADAPPVAVIGHEVWQSRLGGAPDVLGRSVALGSASARVVGVMPEGFGFPVHHDVWTPLDGSPPASVGAGGPALWVMGRLADGRSPEEAAAELSLLGERAAAGGPEASDRLIPRVVPWVRAVLPLDAGEMLGVRSLNLVVVLLVALVCGNVALLLFARSVTRESEIVVRSALGAGRARIVSQLFAEALVLGTVGTLLGLAAAAQGVRFAVYFLGENLGDLPYWVSPSLSPATLLWAAALTVFGAAVAGVLPALRVTRAVGARLRQSGPGGGGGGFGGLWTAVIAAQVAVAVVFPVGALLVWRLGQPIRSFEVGFDESEILSVRLSQGMEDGGPAPAEPSPAERAAGFRATLGELGRRLSAEPGVVGVAFADRLPRTHHPERLIEIEGVPAPEDPAGALTVKAESVDAAFLGLLGARVVAGRGFRPADAEPGERVAIVDEAFVREALQGQNAIGRRFRYGGPVAVDAPASASPPWYEIVGVVTDLGMYHEGGRAGVYHPLEVGLEPVHAVVKVRGQPAELAPRLREVAGSVDPTLRLDDLRPLAEYGVGLERLVDTFARSALVMSALALLLALATLYSVMAFAVSRRTREIGVRVALGADTGRLLLAVFRRPLGQMTLGLALGAWLVLGLVRGAVGGLSARELGLVLAYAGLMMGVCMLACVVPTRRALGIEPTEALREER